MTMQPKDDAIQNPPPENIRIVGCEGGDRVDHGEGAHRGDVGFTSTVLVQQAADLAEAWRDHMHDPADTKKQGHYVERMAGLAETAARMSAASQAIADTPALTLQWMGKRRGGPAFVRAAGPEAGRGLRARYRAWRERRIGAQTLPARIGRAIERALLVVMLLFVLAFTGTSWWACTVLIVFLCTQMAGLSLAHTQAVRATRALDPASAKDEGATERGS